MFPTLALFHILAFLFFGTAAEPPQAKVDDEARANLPACYEVQITERKTNPITSILGTTLPPGSCQIDLRLHVRTKTALYLPIMRYDAFLHWPAEKSRELQHVFDLWSWTRQIPTKTPTGKTRSRPPMAACLFETTPAHTETETWEKLIAQPQGDSAWKIMRMDLDPIFGTGESREHFSETLVYGTPEQVNDQAAAQRAYDHEAEQIRIVEGLQPQIKRLERDGVRALSERYYNEVGVRVQAVWKQRVAALHEHENRLAQIDEQTKSARDNYASRNHLIKEESARLAPMIDAFDAQLKTLDEESRDTGDRARREIHTEVLALMAKAGVDL